MTDTAYPNIVNLDKRGPITVVIIDDHPLIREGIHSLLQKDSGIKVVGEADNSADAMHIIAQESPAVAILDLQIAGESGVSLCWEITKTYKSCAVLVLTAFLNTSLLRQCQAAGASGYLLKDSRTVAIAHAIYTIAEGGTVFDRRALELEKKVFERSEQLFENLSAREFQVLELLCRGRKNDEIAQKLELRLSTVKTHIGTIMRKLDCRNRVEIAARARELNLI